MTNCSQHPRQADDTSHEPAQDPKLRRAYRELSEVTPAPASGVHLSIRERAHSVQSGGRWIWPASVAASLVLCTALVFQLARVVQPRLPSPVAANDGPVTAPAAARDMLPSAERPAPAVGSTPAAGVGTYPIAAESLAAAPDSPEFWWEQLRLHAKNADRAGFLATWEIYQQRRDNPPLPADLRQWMADNQVPLTGRNDG